MDTIWVGTWSTWGYNMAKIPSSTAQIIYCSSEYVRHIRNIIILHLAKGIILRIYYPYFGCDAREKENIHKP